MAVQRTPEQEAVVKNRGGGLLVSAAAGSGKTRVLVERLLDRIVTEGKNVDEFLIITFTRAAAEELRGRIAAEFSEALAKDPENSHLRRQLSLLYQAQISTIHAFCTVLLRQWGQLLELPADFTLCEEEEAQVLMTSTLQQVLEAKYEDITPDSPFASLLDVLGAGQDDSRLLEITLDVFSKIQSDSEPSAWLERQRAAFRLEGITDVGQTSWGRLLLEEAVQKADYWVRQMERAMELAQTDTVLEKAYGESLSDTHADLLAFCEGARQGWDEVAQRSVRFPRLKAAKGVENLTAQAQIKALRDRCKKAAQEMEAQFASPSEALLSDMALVRPAVEGLIDLVEEFSQRYTQEKRKRLLLDFSDLEHYAKRLLLDEAGQPTELARQWGGQYAEIMVDEYQDTNQVQNAIFYALSQQGKNLFLVGDVKQSIYRFRLADPTIFLDKYRRFTPWEQAAEGEERKITLSKNFRSRPEVLEAVNDLFRAMMSRDLGEMDYTDAEALYPGGHFPEGGDYRTELHVLDFTQDPALTENKENKNQLEARFVARRIAALLREGFPVSDGVGGLRPIQPEDVAILLRSPGPVRHWYTQALDEQGIGWSAEEGSDFFQTTEISVALSWLQIMDNPRQDIPLLAVLRSPVCGFSADRLAEIRAGREGDFYEALQAAAQEGFSDCLDFLAQLDALRFSSGEESSHQLLWKLYRSTGLLEIFTAMPGGEKRRENLLTFYELARRFEGTGHKGLFGFLLHLERVQQSGGLRTASSPSGQAGGVKLLSIHRSKGLEYPVVFLCGLGRRFNYGDTQKPVLFHPKLGLGPKGLDRETMVSFSTLARAGTALALKKEMLAEEMRLLYVAMTRAKDKLILTHALSRGISELQGLADSVGLPLDPRVLGECPNVGQWLLLVALTRPEGSVLRRAVQTEDVALSPAPLNWIVALHEGAVSQEVIRRTGEAKTQNAPLEPQALLTQLHWQYPYHLAVSTPAKVTATQADDTRRAVEQAISGEEPGVSLLTLAKTSGLESGQPEQEAQPEQEGKRETLSFHRPQFAQEALGLTPAQKGTALHAVMQCIRLDRTDSVASVREELARLTAEEYLTPQQAEAVLPGAVARFFATELGQEMRRSQQLHREYPFSILAPAETFFPDLPMGEEVLLQGIIDCWFPTEEGLTLVDFKTDRVSAQGAQTRSERYRSQLDIYAYALETVTGQPVTRRILWFLQSNTGVFL